MGKVATQLLLPRGSLLLQSGGQNQKWPSCGHADYLSQPPWGSPPLQSGGQNQKWSTCERGGYLTLATSGIPSASERGVESEVAHVWASWLLNPCHLGDPLRFRAGGRIRSGPPCGQGGYLTLATSGIPSASERGQNQKWPTCGQSGYLTPAASGIPSASERLAESEVAHLGARWLLDPCHLGDPHRFRAKGRIRSGPLVGKVAT